jgi:hypothetical protein
MPAKPLPSAEHLRALFRYDPRSGTLYWRRRADLGATWNARYAGRPAGTSGGGRVMVLVKGFGALQAHRVIWKMIHDHEPAEIDHRDGDPGNNRLANLRAATRGENARNRRSRPGRSGLRGVIRRGSRWAACISVNGRPVRLGTFDDAAAAHRAYCCAARTLFGGFARTD